jgi:DNA-binding PadR family transcriptional regulator
MRHCDHHGNWAAGRRRRRHFGGHGFGGRQGIGDGDMMRAGRMLAQGDLRLIALALIAEQPRHGYEIIKVLEEKTSDWYSPSPGIVYPTLTYLEDVGYLTAQAEGSKKLYSITDEGRAHLEQNRDLVDAVLDRLAAIGERFARWRRMQSRETEEARGSRLPRLIDAALDNLREEATKRIESDADAEARIVEILARAATDLRRT